MPDSGASMPETGEGCPPTETLLHGKYEIGKLLGCGAFAKVYHARNVSSGQSVAVKAISKQKVVMSGLVLHIKREIAIMRRLRHPHIVKLYEVLASRTKIYFILEYVKGGELFARLAKGRLTESLSLRYFQQLIAAVRYCHSRGVYHRDLKPENLLLDENGDLKISDFGLSAVSEQARNDGLFHTLCGTPAYVAPEILTKRGYDAAKADIWACGVILFVLNAGYLPFNDPNLMVMYRKIYRGEFRCPSWTSPEMKRMLHRLLDTNPETRITIDETLKDEWFRGGVKEVKLHEEEAKDDTATATAADEVRSLNAFDIISFSPGFDLSGLLNDRPESDLQRLVSGEPAEAIMARVEAVAKAEGLEARLRMGRRMHMEGKQRGGLGASVDIYTLTESLVLVEARRSGGDARSYESFWKEKLRPALTGL